MSDHQNNPNPADPPSPKSTSNRVDPFFTHASDNPIDHLTFHTTPNYLTLMRILFVPAVVFCLSRETYWWDFTAAVIFGVASITDYLDGYLARKYQIETVYGKLMDPLADKFLVICTYIMLQHLGRIHPVVVMILVCREITITGLRALASAEGIIVSASQGGKWKTALQMGSIPALMVRELFGIPVFTAGLIFTYISLAISLWSAKDYIVEFFKEIKRAASLRKQQKKMLKLEKLARKKARREALREARRLRKQTQTGD
jgi:CDP-diacylglycerol---glycerol-3-phosphate 3-phosphatidyltransferase